MITWGISANSHDAALAVFVDDKLVFASHSERFSKIKNDPDLHDELVQYARKWGDPDLVCWYENPYLKTARQLFSGQGWLLKENNIKQYLMRWNINAPIKFTNHHLSHAAAGYYTSPFDNACVVVIDAIGEWNTLSIWQGEGDALIKVYSIDYPHSIGLWYSAMTQRIGLKPNEEEYILMGMAAYGNPARLYSNIVEDFIFFPSKETGGLPEVTKNLHKGCKDWRPDLTTEQDMFDIAAATQAVYESILLSILEVAARDVKSKNLVLMGGCALNCVANRLTGQFFKNTWIMPNPGDAGSSVGAVLAHTKKRISFTDAYIGYDMGYCSSNEEIVNYLLENKICGVARGKAEFGPRALGNRSLLADPRDPKIKERVNDIKQRQQFRPFSPVILEELVDDYFDMPSGWSTSRYMQVVAGCRYPELFPAIAHFDGSSRVQTVPKDGSPLRLLLERWYALTGCPMLLNTSLNIKGQPIVNDHADSRNWSQRYKVKVFN